MTTIALATSRAHAALAADDRALVPAFEAFGLRAEPVVWDDPSVDWAGYAAAVVRSTWDYHLDPAAFLQWIARVESAGVRLFNPPHVLRWNSDKRYLRELESRGVPIVPTAWIEPGDAPSLAATLAQLGWAEVVVKPVVSASAHGTWRTSVARAEIDADRFATAANASRLMVQPFVDAIRTHGEWSLVFIDGRHSHAVLKQAAAGEYRVQAEWGGRATHLDPGGARIAAAEAVMRALPFAPDDCVYARVDGVEVAGVFRLMELELVEPSLFLDARPGSARDLATAIARRLA